MHIKPEVRGLFRDAGDVIDRIVVWFNVNLFFLVVIFIIDYHTKQITQCLFKLSLRMSLVVFIGTFYLNCVFAHCIVGVDVQD